jgi:hypothetical protein
MPHELTEVITAGQTMFSLLDFDADGAISQEESDRAIGRNYSTEDEMLFVVLLKEHRFGLSKIAKDGPGGVSQRDLRELSDSLRNGTSRVLLPEISISDLYDSNTKAQDKLTDEDRCFTDNDSTKSIDAQKVTQGRTGDCYFLSALNAVAQIAPDTVRKMITIQPDGTYKVVLPGAPNQVYEVAAPSRTEQLYYSTAGTNGYWPLILEKAFSQLMAQGQPHQSSLDAVGIGGNPAVALSALTGRDTETYWTNNTSAAELHQLFSSAATEKLPLVAGCMSASDGFVANHAYAILDYDQSSQLITLRNPYGRGESLLNSDGVNDGIFKVSMQEFCKRFEAIHMVLPQKPEQRLISKPSLG